MTLRLGSPTALPRNLLRAAAVGHVAGCECAHAPGAELTLGPDKRLLYALDVHLTGALERSDLDPEDEAIWDAAAAAFVLALVRSPLAREAAIDTPR